MRRPLPPLRDVATLLLLCLRLCVSQSPGVQIRLGAVTLDGSASTESGARGLQLLQEVVAANLSSPFQLSNGQTVKVALDLRNASTETEVKAVYQAMATSGSDVLVGLGTLSSQVASDVASLSSLVGKAVIFNTWVHDALSSNLPYVFSVGLNNSLTMVEGLLAFKAALDNSSLAVPRPRVVVAIGFCSQDETCLALRSQCMAVVQGYNDTFEMLGPYEFEDTDLAELVFSIKRRNPNLVVACVEKAKAVNLVFTSRALGFAPQGILVSEGTSQGFMRAVGAPNSNYIMSPVGWDPLRPGLSCRVFGDAAGFQTKYQARFGSTPDFYAASAAAAGIAALAAVEQAGQWPLTAQQLRAGMLGVSISTFYRTLSFQTDGSLQDAKSFVRQVLPLPVGYTATARYTSSTSQQVDNQLSLPVFPMPSWQAKEVEVFPCSAGYVLDRTKLNLTCVPCAEGKQRPSFELECRPCTAGLYNLNTGQAMCTRCPVGAVCNGEGVLLPEAQVGYYRMPEFKDGVPFYKICKTGICSGGNQCYGGNTGLLCTQCQAGFTDVGLSLRGKDPACERCPGGFSSFISFVLVILWIVGLAWLFVRLSYKSAISVRAVHSVILKIFGNYVHLVSTVALFTWMGEQPGVSLMVDLALNPLSALAAGGCTLNGFGLPYYQLQTIIGLSMIPFGVSLIYVCHQVKLILDLRRLSAQGYTRRDEDKDLDPVQNPRNSGTSTGNTQEDMRQVAVKEMMMSRTSWTWVVIWGLYPATVRKLLIVLTCQELDVLRLTIQPDVMCGRQAHRNWLIIGVIGIVGVGFGVPALLFWKLRRVRDSLMEDDVRKTYGFLYNGLQPQYYYFEVGFMLRKTIFLLLGAIPSHVMRTIMMFFFSCIYLGVHIRCQPFDNRDFFLLDNLETSGLLALLVTIAMNMMYEYDVYAEEPKLNDFLQSGNGRAAAATVIVVSILINAYAWGLAMWGLLRDSIVKYTHFRAECMPNSVGLLGQLLLKAEPNMNAVHYAPHSHCLDLRRLTRRERMFLQRALCDTMEWYLDSGRPFHPGRLASCVCIAMELCIRERKARARKVALAVCGAAPKRPKTYWERLVHVLTQGASRLWDKLFKNPDEGAETPTVGRARLARGTKTIVREAVERVSDPTAVIDELQNALMHCERSIMGKVEEKFFEIDVPPNTLAQATTEDQEAEGGADGQAEKDKRLNANTLFGGGSHASQFGDKNRLQEHEMNQVSDERQISVSSAAVGLDTKALLQRHEDLKEEAKALREQIAKLQDRLANIRQPDHAVVPVEPQAELDETDQQNQHLKRSVQEDDLQTDLQELLGPGVKLEKRRELPIAEAEPEPKKDTTAPAAAAAAPRDAPVEKEATPRADLGATTWRYTPVNGASMAVRSQPKLDAPSAGSTLRPGQAFRVSEELKSDDGQVTFLKLADGKGWVFDNKPGVGIMCRKAAD